MINRVITGILEENCYIITNDKECIVVDPGDDINKILNSIKDYNLIAILITHYHSDHVGALDELLEYKNVPIYDYKLKEDEYNISSFKFNIIKTPGHTDDSVIFYFKNKNIMFTGDFLFKESIGRTDLGGNDLDMIDSIKRIKTFDKSIKIYPGHGDSSTLEHEFINNIYLNTK